MKVSALLITIFCAVCAEAADVVSSASADMTLLDTTVVTNDVTMARFQAELPVAYSAALWNETSQAGQTASLTVDDEILLDADDEGVCVWSPSRSGVHFLRHIVNGATFVKRVIVPAPDVLIERIGDNLCRLTASDGVSPIRYTLDGTDPTTESALYEGPFAIPLNRMSFVRACTQGEGYVLGAVKSAAFDIRGRCESSSETFATIDTRAGSSVVPVEGVTQVAWSGLWSGDSEADVTVDADGVKILMSKGEGSIEYYPTSVGRHVLTHETRKDGVAVGEKLTATIDVLPVLKKGRVIEGVGQIADGTTEIADGAFANFSDMTSVVIPKTVTHIAPTAFAGCSNVVDVVLPLGADTVVPGFYEAEIRDMNTFSEDNDIKQVARATVLSADMLTAETAPEHTMYGYAAYMWFEGGVTYEFLAYYDDKASIRLDGNWIIQASSSECRSQTGTARFENDGWHWIEIRGWNNAGEGAAYGSCSGVKWRRSGEDWRLFADTGDGALFRVDGFSFGLRSVLPDSYAIVKSVVIVGDDGVVPKAFLKGCASLESVELPDTVESIDAQVFDGCIGLRAITIPSSLRFVGADAFLGCENLKRVDVASLEDWLKIEFANEAANPLCCGAELYVNGEKIVDLVVPEGIGEIRGGAFKGCSDLRSVMIPSSVTTIATTAFAGCSNIEEVTVGGVQWAGEVKPGLLQRKFNTYFDRDSPIDDMCDIVSGVLPAYVKIASDSAAATTPVVDPVFGRQYYFNSQNTTFAYFGYMWMCRGRTYVFGASYDDGAYVKVDGIEVLNTDYSADGGGSLKMASYVCEMDGWHQVEFRVGDKSGGKGPWGDKGWSATFGLGFRDDGLTTATESEWRKLMDPGDGSLFRVEIGGGGRICDLFPDSPIVAVTIGDEVEALPDGFFADCTMMESVSLPDSLMTIGSETFKGCSSLAAIAIPSGVTNIGANAFAGCENLTHVNVPNMEDWLAICFENAEANPLHTGAALHVGNQEVSELVIPEGVAEVLDFALKGGQFTSVTIPNSVTNIATTAFEGCDNITNVALYGGVSSSQQIVPELIEGTKWTEEPETLDGDKVYKSNVINHNQSTAVEFAIPEGMEQLVFSWKVGSENNYDWLTWYLDDVQKDRISGSRDWVTLTNELDGTAHRLKFVYSKDGSASTSPDCGWVSVHGSAKGPTKLRDLFPDAPLCRVEVGGAIMELPREFFDGFEMLEELVVPGTVALPSDAFAVFPKLRSAETSYAGVKLRYDREGVVDSVEETTGSVVIPGSLNGQFVRKIAEDAFVGMTGITSLEIGDGIEEIGEGAFDGCVNLSVLILPVGFELGFNAFERFPSLRWIETTAGGCGFKYDQSGVIYPTGMCTGSVRVPGTLNNYPIVKIGDGAFAGMTGITAIEIGEGIVELGDGAFDGCTSLSSIVLPETLEDFGDNDVREIGRRGGKSGLWVQDGWALGYIGTAPAEVTIPDGVKGIAAFAFEGQYDLERVVLPESLKFIGKDAFAGCTSLEGLDLPEGCGRIDDGAFRDCTWIQEVSLASGLTNIGAAAFANCAGLSVLIAPEGLKAMGEGAFSNCWRMVSASLPVSLDAVGSNCFWNCKNLSGVTVPTHVQPLKTLFPAAYGVLTSIVIAEGETHLFEGVFDGCATVKEIVLPEAVTEIPAAAFRDCVSLERMAFPAAVKSIGEEAFAGCVGLTRLNLPAGLEAIGARAFEGLSELEQMAIPDGVTAIGAGAFAGCGAVRQVRLPGNVTTLAAAFPDAYAKIVRAEVPEGTTELIAGLFDGCAALESFTIPASVTDIGARAFAGCGALKAVALSKGLKTIGDEAFSGVSGILELEIPSSVESLGAGAFTGCAALRAVTLPGDTGTLAGIFPDAYKAMVSVTVTDGTETLNDGFFAGCVSLKAVELPTSVAVIGAGAFEDCTSLASVGIPAGVTSLGAGTFRGCSALAEVTLPGGLSVLEDQVFADCSLLAAVTVPESVTTLGSRIFDGCTALRLVKFIGNAPQVAADAYAGTPSELVTQVATGSRGWDGIATSRNLPEFWPSGTTHGIGWWDPTRFEVTFDSNDGSGASEMVEEITDTTYKLPDTDPVHPGAAFLGWWTEAVNGARITPVSRVMRTSAHTLYAHWRPFSYTVTFDANGGTGVMEEQTMTVDEPANLPLRGFVCINHDFVGWALEPEGEVAFSDGEEVVNLSMADGGTVRLYAVWTEREWSAADYLGAKGLAFASDGDADWFPDVETSHDGIGSMRSGEIGIADEGETTRSTLRTTVVGKGTLTFWWKVNCEGPDPDYGDLYDYLEFTVDGERPVAVDPIAGDVDWTKVEVRIEGRTPTHELAWSFVKDDWDEEPLPDIAWVDELTWTPDPVTVTFDGSGATEGSVPAAVTSSAGAKLILPDAGTLRKGLSKFVGWSDGKRVYAAGETYVVGSVDVTLSAVWEEFTIADALNTTDLAFTTGGDATWTIDFETSHDGEASMRSGAVGTSQTSWIEATVNGAGTLTFVWKADGLLNRGKPANYVQYVLDGGDPVQVAVCDWTAVEVEVKGAGEHTVRWMYLHTRSQDTGADCAWIDEVEWTVAALPKPSVEGDEGATVTGDAEAGFVIKPSEGKTAVEVTIPQGVDAAKVTVEVSPKVASVKPNGAKVKIVSGNADITEFLNVPAADGNGVIDLTKATVKEEIVNETLDPAKGAVIELNAANPKLTTPNTRIGLFYTFSEGRTLGGMERSASKTGDGEPFSPEIKVKGGNSAFYSIGVGKGE